MRSHRSVVLALTIPLGLTACASSEADPSPPPSSGASAGAALAGSRCHAVSDEQLGEWAGAPQEVEQASDSPLACHGVHLEVDDWISVDWRFHDLPGGFDIWARAETQFVGDPRPLLLSDGTRAVVDHGRAPWLVVLYVPVGDQGLEVTVRNDSTSEKVPVARLVEIARHVAEAYR